MAIPLLKPFTTISYNTAHRNLHHPIFSYKKSVCCASLSVSDFVGSEAGVCLSVGTHLIPHPDKVEKGGEDAFFVSSYGGGVIAVADGVSGWAEKDVNPALFSRELIANVSSFVEEEEVNHNPRSLISKAHAATTSIGSATAVVAMLERNGILKIASVGDCGLRVIRKGQVVFSTSPQEHYFDAVCCCASTASTPQGISKSWSNSTETATAVSLKPIVVNGDPPTSVSAPGRRIIAVGDLHGDLDKARHALQMAGILSSDGQDLWVGGETVLVQLGDILDRGEDEIAILSLLKSLNIQAKANGGAVFQVNGNHETMNVEGDFRYVDSGGFDECADFLEHLEICDHNWEQAFVSWAGVSKGRKEGRKVPQNYWGPWNLVQRQKGVIARSVLLRPGGPLASELAQHAVVLKVNDWIFCHGGLLPHHVEYGIERINREVSYWMQGLSAEDDHPEIPFIATKGYDSVVWSRLYSRDTSDLDDYQINQIQSILRETLEAVGAKAMVVGHTPQATGVNCEFNCSIWRIDVGMSSGVLDSRPEVLEIREGRARAIRSNIVSSK